MIDTKYRSKFDKLFNKIACCIAKYNITPNQITLLAFAVGMLSSVFIMTKTNTIALTLLWISGFLDVMDGAVARIKNQTSDSGMYMDLTLDRMVEAAIILALAITYPDHRIGLLLFVIAALFNFTTFMIAGIIYKKNTLKGMYYDIGIIERTEAFIAFTLMILFPGMLSVILFVINSLIFLTGFIRFYRINMELKIKY